ncbi:MAG TPA: RNA polymerase sigma factor [Woeseiaceae bacterium]|nr:RNA polymerase sigma factor [Woeseiaceae bacterium]
MKNIIPLKRHDSNSKRFDVLVRPHFDALYAAARRLTRSPHDAEDLVQEVCLKAFGRLDELERIEFSRAWLLKVLYHEFIDSKRRNQRSPVAIAATGAETDEPDLTPADSTQPDELVDHQQNIGRIQRAMRLLNPEQCALVVMHDVEGYSIDELCKLNGAPAGTIKAQLHRTRVKLGRLLASGAMTAPPLKIVGVKL